MSTSSSSLSSSPTSQLSISSSTILSEMEVRNVRKISHRNLSFADTLHIKLIKKLHNYFSYRHTQKNEFEVGLCGEITACLRGKLTHRLISFPKDAQVRKIFDLAINTATSQVVEGWLDEARERRLALKQELGEAACLTEDQYLQNRLDLIRRQMQRNEDKIRLMKNFREDGCVFTRPLFESVPRSSPPLPSEQ